MPASTPNTPAANPHLVCMQAAEVHEKNEFRGEPHLHVLANLFDIIIVVVQRRAREIWLTQYSPGCTLGYDPPWPGASEKQRSSSNLATPAR